MRGYFGFGAEGISKPMNMGNLVRSAHAFGAQFVFTVSAHYSVREGKSDTSKAPNHLPWYDWDKPEEMNLPNKCKLVGVELVDDAVEMFREAFLGAWTACAGSLLCSSFFCGKYANAHK